MNYGYIHYSLSFSLSLSLMILTARFIHSFIFCMCLFNFCVVFFCPRRLETLKYLKSPWSPLPVSRVSTPPRRRFWPCGARSLVGNWKIRIQHISRLFFLLHLWHVVVWRKTGGSSSSSSSSHFPHFQPPSIHPADFPFYSSFFPQKFSLSVIFFRPYRRHHQ